MLATNVSSPHDRSRRHLFAHPEVIEDLLRGTVHEAWVDELDFSTLHHETGIFVSEQLDERIADVIWSVRWRDRELFVLVLVEFQSRVDPFMALRKLEYVARFYRELKRQDRLLLDRRLPPVLPIVVYNGTRVWRAPRRLSELIAEVPDELRQYQPDMQYLLVDELRLPAELGASRDLLAAIAALEQSDGPEGILSVVERLIAWLTSDEDSDLRRAFAAWIRLVLAPIKLEKGEQLPEVDNLMEMHDMLVERMQRWVDRQQMEMRTEIRREVEAQVEAQVKAQVKAQVEAQVEAQVKAQVDTATVDFLVKQIERKFGPLSPTHRARIRGASPEQREQWGLRLLDATSLDELFG